MIKTKRFEMHLKELAAAAGIFFFLAVLSGTARAGDPVHLESEGFGAYGVRYLSVTASSATVNSIPALGQDGWREVACVASDNSSSTTIFSNASGVTVTTTTLATAGSRFPFTAYLGRHWNTSKSIQFSVAAGATAVPLDCEIWTTR